MENPGPIVVIRNPAAGQRSGPFVDKVMNEIKARGVDVTAIFTNSAGHAEELAAELAEAGKASLVVASGGDGTVREVACGLYGSDMPLGLIPAGTANVLARELGYLKSGQPDIKRTTDILLEGRSATLFPFEVGSSSNRRLGLCWLGAGFDAETLLCVSPAWKKWIGRAAFVPAIFKALGREKRIGTFEWRIDAAKNEGIQGWCGWSVIANIQRYAGPFVLTRRTAINTQGVACLLFAKSGAVARLIEQVQIAFRPLDQRGKTKLLQEGSIRLGNDKTPLQLDGDFAGYGPVTVTPLKQALHVKAAEG